MKGLVMFMCRHFISSSNVCCHRFMWTFC